MNILHEWSEYNSILINKKKSGMIIVDQATGNKVEINRYLIHKTYKYLKIKINNTLSQIVRVNEMNVKLTTYLKKKCWLLKIQFTSKT